MLWIQLANYSHSFEIFHWSPWTLEEEAMNRECRFVKTGIVDAGEVGSLKCPPGCLEWGIAVNPRTAHLAAEWGYGICDDSSCP